MFEQLLVRAKVSDWDYVEHKLCKKWVEGYIHPTSVTSDCVTWGITLPERESCYMSTNEYEVYSPKTYSFVKDTVSRWTGKFDRFGKKIFEDDIVEAEMDYGPAGMYLTRAVIYWHSECGWQWNYFDMDTIEVIGNIHDDPDIELGLVLKET